MNTHSWAKSTLPSEPGFTYFNGYNYALCCSVFSVKITETRRDSFENSFFYYWNTMYHHNSFVGCSEIVIADRMMISVHVTADKKVSNGIKSSPGSMCCSCKASAILFTVYKIAVYKNALSSLKISSKLIQSRNLQAIF